MYLLVRTCCLCIDHEVLQYLFLNEPKAYARNSGWLATMLKYPFQIEYVSRLVTTIAEVLFRLDIVAINAEVTPDIARGVPSYACLFAQADRPYARTDW